MSKEYIISFIRDTIAEKGLKQKAVAEAARIGERQFSAIIHGRRKLAADEALRLCAVLGCTPNELYGYDGSAA